VDLDQTIGNCGFEVDASMHHLLIGLEESVQSLLVWIF
jgi:hypothetical protein